MRPDRLVVGEVRGAEVVELLAALNTGHEGGCGTIHANSARDVPARVEALALAAGLDREAAHSQLSPGSTRSSTWRATATASGACARSRSRRAARRAGRRWCPRCPWPAISCAKDVVPPGWPRCCGCERPRRAGRPGGCRRLRTPGSRATAAVVAPRTAPVLGSPACPGPPGPARGLAAARLAGAGCRRRGSSVRVRLLWRRRRERRAAAQTARPGARGLRARSPPSSPPGSRPAPRSPRRPTPGRSCARWPTRSGSVATCRPRSASWPRGPARPTCDCSPRPGTSRTAPGQGWPTRVDRVAATPSPRPGHPPRRRRGAGLGPRDRPAGRACCPWSRWLMGSGVGGDPVDVPPRHPAGLAVPRGGLAFGFAGLWWIEALAREVDRGVTAPALVAALATCCSAALLAPVAPRFGSPAPARSASAGSDWLRRWRPLWSLLAGVAAACFVSAAGPGWARRP